MPSRSPVRALRPRVVLVASSLLCLAMVATGTVLAHFHSGQDIAAPTPTSTAPRQTTPVPTPSPSPTTPLGRGPTEADLAAGIATASAMSLQQVAGQVIVARYDGTDPKTAAQLVGSGLGGVILFSQNIDGLDQVLSTTAEVRAAQADTKRDWPAIVGVDQEGGLVQRLEHPWTPFPNFLAAGAAVQAPQGTQVVTDAYAAQARELRAGGFNVNFAPDADVISPTDTVIGPRSAGTDPTVVSRAVVAALSGFRSQGVLAAAKHFPGHGTVGVDSHSDLPVQKAQPGQLASRELRPFAAAIAAGVPMVMVGHIAVQAWDATEPASLSPAAYQHLRSLGFTGVAVTDGLDMEAVTKDRSSAQIAVQAIAAGADLLLTPPDAAAARQGLVDAVNAGTLERDRLNEAAGRVVTMMRWQARQAQALPADDASALGSATGPVAALAAAAITDVSTPCPRPALHGPFRFTGADASIRARIEDLATARGIQVTQDPAATEVRLVQDSGSGSADAAIGLGGPAALAAVQAPVKIVAYDSTDATLSAALTALTDGRSPGRLPIPLGSLQVGAGCS